jgi:protein-arginine kinase activator protein McsA
MQGKQIPLHVGKSPEQRVRKGALSARLETLHLALGEAIAFENYEEAAALRDQIKELMEKHRGVA